MMMTDQIFLKQLVLPARIGVLEHEKQAAQPIVLDIELNVDTRLAAQSDDLSDTVDYAALAQQLAAHCIKQHVELVETLSQQLADICLADKRVQQVTLSIGKPDALHNAASVGVRITRVQQ
jgi:dihydroneopterin aldolase